MRLSYRSLLAAFSLILASLFVGYTIEKAYARASGYIRDWKSLLIVVAVLYGCLVTSMIYLLLNANSEQVSGRFMLFADCCYPTATALSHAESSSVHGAN